MPITTGSSVESFQITATQTNFATRTLTVTFNHMLNGVRIGQFDWPLPPAAFAALFTQPSDGATPLSVWVTNALYNAAVASGVIAGTVSPDA
jgi:hypothetical protein